MLKKTEIDLLQLTKDLNNLRNFRVEKKFQEAALTFMVNQIYTNQEKQELLQQFQALDLNGNGRLSKKELIFGFASDVQLEVTNLMKQIDEDKMEVQIIEGFINFRIQRGYFKKSQISRKQTIRITKIQKQLLAEVVTNGDGSVYKIFQIFIQNILFLDQLLGIQRNYCQNHKCQQNDYILYIQWITYSLLLQLI